MAMDAKISFMQEMEKALEDKITAADLMKILTVVSDIMEGYDMRSITVWADDTDDLLDSYISALNVENRSQKTLDRYRYVIGKLMEFAKVPTRRVTIYHIRSFLAAEKERGIGDSTLEGYREIYSAYFNWLQRESLIERNPTANLGTIKCPKKKKELYTDVDIEKLKRNCKCARDLAIILFLNATCCRISEVVELNRDQVNVTDRKCVVHGKGDKERKVYFDMVTAEALQQYLDERKDNCEALFINRYKRRFQAGGIRAMLNEVAGIAGVQHVHPHKFRRTKATSLAAHGMPIQDVQAILGHEKIDTTMKYVQMDDIDVENAYRRFA